MSAVSGGLWLEDEFPSPPRLNRKTIFHGTGNEIAAIGLTFPGMLAFCTADGAGFFANSYYKRNATDTDWEAVGAGIHYHDSDDDTGGGSLQKVMQANISRLLYCDKTHVPRSSMFRTVFGASGSISEQSNGNVRLVTGGTSGSYGDLYDVGKLDFGFNSSFVIRIESFNNTQVAIRFGINAEPYSVADDTGAKYGLEFCDSAGVATNFYIFSSDGTQRGSSVTSINGLTSGSKGFRVEHEPSNIIRVFYDNLPKETRSQLIPGVGDVTPTGNLFTCGIKVNDTNTKNLDVYGYLVVGTRSSLGWS